MGIMRSDDSHRKGKHGKKSDQKSDVSSKDAMSEAEKQLGYKIKEIKSTEDTFRNSMNVFYMVLKTHKDALPPDFLKELEELLQPYEQLRSNPLAEVDTDSKSKEENLSTIVEAFRDGQAMHQQYDAFLSAIKTLERLNRLFRRMEADPHASEWLQMVLAQFNRMNHSGFAQFDDVTIMPVQRLPRINMLAEDILKLSRHVGGLQPLSEELAASVTTYTKNLNENKQEYGDSITKEFTLMLMQELEKIAEKLPLAQQDFIHTAMDTISKANYDNKENYLKVIAKSILKLHPSHHAKNGLFRGVSKIDKGIYELEKKIAQHPFCGSKTAYNTARAAAKTDLKKERETQKSELKGKSHP